MQKRSPGAAGVPHSGQNASGSDAGAGAGAGSGAGGSGIGAGGTGTGSGSGTGAGSGAGGTGSGAGDRLRGGLGSRHGLRDRRHRNGLGGRGRRRSSLGHRDGLGGPVAGGVKLVPAVHAEEIADVHGRATRRARRSARGNGGRRGSRGERSLNLGHGLAAARAEHVGGANLRAAERAGKAHDGVLGGLGLPLDAIELNLNLRALGIDRGNAVVERLATGAEAGVVLRELVEARAQLGGEVLAALEGVGTSDS